MNRHIYLIALITTLSIFKAQAQWQNINPLTDLNAWSSLPGFIGYYGTSTNAPTSSPYGSGLQTVLPTDGRYGSQIILPAFDNQMFYRNISANTWGSWYKVWSSVNFDPDTYLDRSVAAISSAGSANSFINGYTFSYATSGTPWSGSLISFGGFGGSYDTQINSNYNNGGKGISFRTMNGDTQTWNGWNELYHSGNLNRNDVDFTARTINCTNVYTNGNLWSKQIIVAITNPWPDYVFKRDYKLPTLSEVKTYIDRNHHLPELPSEKEVAEKGLNLGEMNKLLVKKVEELTLYMFELKSEKEKTSHDQQLQIDQLKKQVNELSNNHKR